MLLKSSMLLLGATLVGGVAVCDLCQPLPARVVSFAPVPLAASRAALVPDSLMRVTFRVDGMTCGGCTLATRKVLTRLPGIVRADVTYEPPQAVVTYDPAKVTPAQMIAAVKTLTYTATVVADPKPAPAMGARTGAE